MTKLKGTNLAAPVMPFDSADEYPTHDPIYGVGGWREVADQTARDAIPAQRRRAGMVVVCQDTNTAFQLQADKSTWKEFQTGGGSGGRYDIAIYYPGKPSDGQVIAVIGLPASIKLAAGLATSIFSLLVSPTADATFSIQRNGGVIGTVTFHPTGAPTVSFPVDVVFSVRDALEIVAPSPSDNTAAYPSFTLVASIVSTTP